MSSVIVWSKDNCPYCVQAIQRLERLDIAHEVRKIGDPWTKEQLLESCPDARTVPQIVINGTPIGGLSDMNKYIEETGFNGTGLTL